MGVWQRMADDLARLPLPPAFHVVELGAQRLCYGDHGPAAALYRSLGCGRYESLDGNGEGTLLHDLNLPPPAIGTFDLVTDFGTGEHIFDQAQVWRTIHALARVGGHIAVVRPEQGYPGHCFYRTDECMFHDVAHANDYATLKLERIDTTRGSNFFAIFRRTNDGEFRIPQQGRYLRTLKTP